MARAHASAPAPEPAAQSAAGSGAGQPSGLMPISTTSMSIGVPAGTLLPAGSD